MWYPGRWSSRAGFPPILLSHGTADPLVHYNQTLRMFEALQRAGVPVDVHLYAGQSHGFDTQREFAREMASVVEAFLLRPLPAGSEA